MLVTQSWSPGRQVFVPGTAEVLARHPVGEDPVPGDALPLQGQMLALCVLVGAGYTGVIVHAVHDMLLGMAGRGLSFFRDTAEGIRHPPRGRQPCGRVAGDGEGRRNRMQKTRFFHLFCRQMEKACFLSCHMKNPGWVAGKMWPVAGSVSVLGRGRAGSVSVFPFS